ncbi:MAG: hypothetical protein HQ568_09770, partial [Calditrichaeota bacterium]|nr:hypothetical protein [Calditrichota bacterium]
MTSPQFSLRSLALVVITIFLIFSPANNILAQSVGCCVDVISSDQTGFEMEVEVLDLDIQAELQNGFERNRV